MFTNNKHDFCTMKRKRNMLFRVVFLFALLFKMGLLSYSDLRNPVYSHEITSDESNFDNFSVSDIIALDENMAADQSGTIWTAELPESKTQITDSNSILYSYCISIWQPPEI